MKNSVSFQGQAGRRQLLAALGSLAVFTFLFGRFGKKTGTRQTLPAGEGVIDCSTPTGKTARLLTQDGRLVEVDPSLGRPVKKVSNEELRDWIKPAKP